jgi:hypothetical protein
LRLPPDVIATTGSRREENLKYNRQWGRASFAIRLPRDSRTDAALAMSPSLFRFPSVASRPRFSHDPVNLAPDCDG